MAFVENGDWERDLHFSGVGPSLSLSFLTLLLKGGWNRFGGSWQHNRMRIIINISVSYSLKMALVLSIRLRSAGAAINGNFSVRDRERFLLSSHSPCRWLVTVPVRFAWLTMSRGGVAYQGKRE